MSSDLMDEALTGTDGEITASHLLAFRERLQEEVSKWMNEICFPQSASYIKRVWMSSACVGQGTKEEPIHTESTGFGAELQ